MKFSFILFFIIPLSLFSQNQGILPIRNTVEGKRSFDDLTLYYEKDSVPDYKKAVNDLNSEDDSIRKSASEYIYSLFEQSYKDEKNGRSEWVKMPFFNETWESRASNFRGDLARYCANNASSAAILESANWLIFEDYNENNKLEGMKLVQKIIAPESDKILEKIIKHPEIDYKIVARAITEAADRQLSHLYPDIEKLQNHYSKKIRNAVRDNALKLNLKIADFDPQNSITPWLNEQFNVIYRMILDEVPTDAKFVNYVRSSDSTRKEEVYETGYLLKEDSLYYRVLDCSGQVSLLNKEKTLVFETTLEAEATKIVERTGSWNQKMFYSYYEGELFVRQLTIAAWCYHYGLTKEAASIIVGIIDAAGSNADFSSLIKNCFGNLYHNEMLIAFSYKRDYNRAVTYAEHLSGNDFSGFNYQSRAVELANQLKHRTEDFTTLVLPDKKGWDSLKLILPRYEQIAYLLKRLRLLNCHQYSQPGGISYSEPQTMKLNSGMNDMNSFYRDINDSALQVINPYSELIKMKLGIGELKYLVPLIADSSFILSYSYHRSFHSQRILYRVSWVIADLLFRISHKDLADLDNFEMLDNSGRKKKIDSVLQWCEANKNKTGKELNIEIMQTTKNWREFETCMNVGLRDSCTSMIPILIQRINDFSDNSWPSCKGKIAGSVYRLSSEGQVDIARKWQDSSDEWVRLYSSLILLKYGDSQNLEGINTLKKVLVQCDGTTWYPEAVPVLINLHNPEAFSLAEGIINARLFKSYFDGPYYRDILRKLFLAGSRKVLEFMVNGLENTDIDNGKTAADPSITLLKSDEFACVAWDWHAEETEYDIHWPVDKRIEICNSWSKWLQEQFQLIKEGKPHQIKTSFDVVGKPVEYVDTP